MTLVDFTLNGQRGRLELEYRVNDSLQHSGFDMFDPGDFDPTLTLGYPTLTASVHDYAGSGYRTASAFIQWIDIERQGSTMVRGRELDTPPQFREAGVPFFSIGYPANLYDAPAHNMQGARWMSWVATTWLVAFPARWTNFEIRPVVGFRWGYHEDVQTGVAVTPLRSVGPQEWNDARPWLQRECPAFTFARS